MSTAPGTTRSSSGGRSPGRAWIYAQSDRLGVPIVPIPGTKQVKWLEQNVGSTDITLSHEELALLDQLAAQVVGARY
jgi:aryl-alcohol dehydrogenase-like predicted oxidoreductase